VDFLLNLVIFAEKPVAALLKNIHVLITMVGILPYRQPITTPFKI